MSGEGHHIHRRKGKPKLGQQKVIASLSVLLLTLAVRTETFDRARASSAAFQPTFQEVPCPPGVTAEEGSKVSCGYLTVLENRDISNGRTIRLFVTKAEPLEGRPPPDPMFGPGPLSQDRDLGWSAQVRQVGARAGRVLYSMDPRGIGYSGPSLACPEIERLTDPSFGVALGTPEMETAFLQAVQACHDRLVASGIDLASYNLETMAADAEDLRTALGIDRWNLITWGTASSISFEIMRRYPEHVRSVVMDSPLPPQVDRFTGAVVGTEWALRQVIQACKAQRPCRETYPHLRAAWRDALRGLDAHPSEISDEDLKIVVDDATAVRYLRDNLALGINHTSDIPQFPLAIFDLKKHGWVNGEPAGNEVFWTGAPPFDVGVDLQWNTPWGRGDPGWGGALSHGTFYSYLCHDEVPFIDQQALAEAAGGRPWYVEAYVQSPYAQLCDRWDVGQASSDPHAPLRSDIPTLLMVGRFDPFSPSPLVRRAAAKLSKGWVLQIPAKSRNVFSTDCTVEIRTAFVDDPTSLPDTSCVADLEGVEFVPPPPQTESPKPGDAVITTVAGDGAEFGSSGDGSLATKAQITPVDVAVDAGGNLYVLDWDYERVRKVDLSGRISTAIGPPTGLAPPPPGDAATIFAGESALAIDSEGNLYVGGGQGGIHAITRVEPSGHATVIAGTGERGFSGDGGPATDAQISQASDIAVDDQGNVYFTDWNNNRVRKIDTSGIITTVAGTGKGGFSGDGGPATDAKLARPSAIFVDDKGRIYFFDHGNRRVRRVDAQGIITTVSGNGKGGCPRDGRVATKAAVAGAVLKDASGNLYIASAGCSRIWMVNSDRSFITVVGTGIPGGSGDGGPADLAELRTPSRIAFGPEGSLYVADFLDGRVRKVVFP